MRLWRCTEFEKHINDNLGKLVDLKSFQSARADELEMFLKRKNGHNPNTGTSVARSVSISSASKGPRIVNGGQVVREMQEVQSFVWKDLGNISKSFNVYYIIPNVRATLWLYLEALCASET